MFERLEVKMKHKTYSVIILFAIVVIGSIFLVESVLAVQFPNWQPADAQTDDNLSNFGESDSLTFGLASNDPEDCEVVNHENITNVGDYMSYGDSDTYAPHDPVGQQGEICHDPIRCLPPPCSTPTCQPPTRTPTCPCPTKTPTRLPPTRTPTRRPTRVFTNTPTDPPPTNTPTDPPPTMTLTNTPTDPPPTYTPTDPPPTYTPTDPPPTYTPTDTPSEPTPHPTQPPPPAATAAPPAAPSVGSASSPIWLVLSAISAMSLSGLSLGIWYKRRK